MPYASAKINKSIMVYKAEPKFEARQCSSDALAYNQ